MAFNRTANVAQYKGADWTNLVNKVADCTPETAQRIAMRDPNITFFFFCRESMMLEGKGFFSPGDAVFFTGQPSWGSAPQCDGYEKANDCDIPIGKPYIPPFRTGSYLIYDYKPSGKDEDNFRRGDSLTPEFRASGSHQLDVPLLTSRLKEVATKVSSDQALYLIDLRQESHVFFDDRAVSWYADKDWANVGRSLDWIEADEARQLKMIETNPTTQIFCYKKGARAVDEDRVIPLGYRNVTVKSSATEKIAAQQLKLTCKVDYERFPVTDHCIPGPAVLNEFIDFVRSVKDPTKNWLHFHCHGGDGRTTTFLALYDMMYWAKTRGTKEFPTLQKFIDRQCDLFKYSLDPNAHCKEKPTPPADPNWKYWLAYQRWILLGMMRDFIASGKFMAGEPFVFPTNWDELLGLKRG